MYERRYGEKYNQLGGYQSAAEIAKLMRGDIKDLIAKGELPGKAANYSVRVHNYSGGRAIYIEARDLDGLWETCDGIKRGSKHEFEGGGFVATSCNNYAHDHGESHERLSEEGDRIQSILEKVHRAYNYDGSEVMVDYFDVNYYGNASIEDAWDRKWRLSQKAKKDAKKAAA